MILVTFEFCKKYFNPCRDIAELVKILIENACTTRLRLFIRRIELINNLFEPKLNDIAKFIDC